MTKEQVEKNQKLFDLIGALSSAFSAALICLFIATPDSIIESPLLASSRRIWALLFFFAPIFSYTAFYFLVWKLHSIYKLGGGLNWLWILLLSNFSIWQFVVFAHNWRFRGLEIGEALNAGLPLLSVFVLTSFLPWSFIWLLGFCYRIVWRNADESDLSLKLS